MNKALQCIGLAKKAGRLAAGTQNVIDAIRSKKAFTVIVASDVSDNTAKLLGDKSTSYGVRIKNSEYTRAELGNILGTAACACVAFTDSSFALMYQRAIEELRR